MHEQHHTNRKKWGRRAVVVAVFFALGFVFNVGIAWRIQRISILTLATQRTAPDRIAGWERVRPDRTMYETLDRWRYWSTANSQRSVYKETDPDTYTRGPSLHGYRVVDRLRVRPPWLNMPGIDDHDHGPDSVIYSAIVYGYPFRTTRQTFVSKGETPKHQQMQVMLRTFEDNAGTLVVRFKPFSIKRGGLGYPLNFLPLGATLGAVMWGLILWLPFTGAVTSARALRRRRRRRRNQCVASAYSLDGITSPACPECGQPILSTSPLKGRGREAQPSG